MFSSVGTTSYLHFGRGHLLYSGTSCLNWELRQNNIYNEVERNVILSFKP